MRGIITTIAVATLKKAAKEFEAVPRGQQEHERKQIDENSEGEATEEIAWLRSAEDDKENGKKCGNHKEEDLRRSFVWRFLCGLHAA
jgi:hypothetical protein